MRKRSRTILFIICVILFILLAPSVALYSQGYRFDFEKRKITQTGGLYFKVQPNGAEVYIDSKLKKKTDFLFNTVFIKNLLPKKYKITIQSDGYQNWEKTLEIKENLVTEAKNIALVPEKPKIEILNKGVGDFSFSPDERKIIFQKKGEAGWYLTLFNLDRNVESVLIEEKNLSKNGADFLNLQWSPDSKKIILETAVTEREKYFILELDNSLPLSPISLDFIGDVEKISFNPQNSQKIFYLKNKNLFEADYKTRIASKPILTNLITYEISNGNIFGLDYAGFLIKSDFSEGVQEKINSEALSLKDEVEYKIIPYPQDILIQEENILYLLDKNTKTFKDIFKPVRELKIARDFQKAAFFSDYEVWIFYLKDILEQSPKKTYEIQLISRFSEKIDDVFWLTNHYLILNVGGKIKIAEIDDRDKVQIWNFSEMENSEIFFNKKDRKIYLLSNNNIYFSESLF